MTSALRGPMMKARAAVDVRGLGGFAGMAGSSIARRSAANWVTHFLNASYYGVPRDRRDLGNLRVAWAVLTTYWHQLGGDKLGARQVRRFHHSFRDSGSSGGSHYPRTLLDRDQLESGAGRLLGPWFHEAKADPARTGWGVVFETAAERADRTQRRRVRGLGGRIIHDRERVCRYRRRLCPVRRHGAADAAKHQPRVSGAQGPRASGLRFRGTAARTPEEVGRSR